ncbi:MAG: glycosyltransferase family 2 protein [Anaerolineales bacterium]|nr:glycosyltransferase family 2 protein [Anaerolineales bacterium]
MTTPPPTIWVIVLHWQDLADTAACLEALRAQTGVVCQVGLVDNDPGEPARALAGPGVHYLAAGRNLGYAEGNNLGLRYALDHGAAYLLVLNNDTVAPPEMCGRLLEAVEADERIGLVCPTIASWAQPALRFTPSIDWACGQAGETWMPANDAATRPVDYASGCALLARAAAVRAVGLFDAAYFAYYEDVDWSLRFQEAGYRTLIVPETCVYHKGTPDQRPAKSPGAWYYFTRNQMRFIRRYTPRRRRLSLLRAFTQSALANFTQVRAAQQLVNADAILDGWWAGLRGQSGPERPPAPGWVKALLAARPEWWLWLSASRLEWRGRARVRTRLRRLWPRGSKV